MIFARLEQVTPGSSVNEPFIFCSKCRTYYYGGRPGLFCCMCGHKFREKKRPIMLTVTADQEMTHEEAVRYVRDKVFGKRGTENASGN